jgi:hypothetical protein
MRMSIEQLETRDIPAAAAWNFAMGYNDHGQGKVRYEPDAHQHYTFSTQQALYYDQYGNFQSQELRVAVGDVNRDGVADVITANGPHAVWPASQISYSTAELRVFDGSTIASGQVRMIGRITLPWVGGAYLAAGDVDGDGYADIAAGRDITDGGSGQYPAVPNKVAIYSGKSIATSAGKSIAATGVFSGIEDPGWQRGTTVAIGDVSGDKKPDVVVATGTGGAPRTAVWDGASLLPFKTPRKVCGDFFSGNINDRRGTSVAVADLNRDGYAEVITGALDRYIDPYVYYQDGRILVTGGTLTREYIDLNHNADGYRMVVKDLNGDQLPDFAFSSPRRAYIDSNGGSVALYRGLGIVPNTLDYDVQLLKTYDPLNGLLSSPNTGAIWVG